ncbi:MAG TPA: hypothetical protein VFL57_16940 [Bryobacteraceae bacterium]|nr:hypothetical protein [Bryobacteraceae bacterium]
MRGSPPQNARSTRAALAGRPGVYCPGALFVALPERLSPGPKWLLVAIMAALLIAGWISHHLGRANLNQRIGYLLSAAITVALAWSLFALVSSLPAHKQSATNLLRAGSVLWAANILVFASWYWRLDAGGPHQRAARGHHREGAFLFPQMTREHAIAWRPGFVDYLFVAFNTSTAFSPTDVSPLSRWAKVLMMTQSLISLTTIGVLVSRAVNIL